MQLFVAQEMKENEDYLYEDAGISIELNTVIDRIVWHENFEKKYPDFILKRSSIDLRVWHQTAILKGSDNSSIEQYREEGSTEKIQLEENFSKAFNYSLKTYPQSEISQAIVKLLKVVNSNDRKKIDALLKTFGSQKIIYDYNDENGE